MTKENLTESGESIIYSLTTVSLSIKATLFPGLNMEKL
jgi:hypothetical protein